MKVVSSGHQSTHILNLTFHKFFSLKWWYTIHLIPMTLTRVVTRTSETICGGWGIYEFLEDVRGVGVEVNDFLILNPWVLFGSISIRPEIWEKHRYTTTYQGCKKINTNYNNTFFRIVIVAHTLIVPLTRAGTLGLGLL